MVIRQVITHSIDDDDDDDGDASDLMIMVL